MVTVDGVRMPTANAVVLVRHGRTKLNQEGRLRGRLDPELDLEGRREVAFLARSLAACNITKIISSPLQRARQTAVAIDQMHHTGIHLDARLIDRDYGEYAGAKKSDVVNEFGSLDNAPGVEPAESVRSRVLELLNESAGALSDGLTVLVSHDVVNTFLLTELGEQEGQIAQHTACWNLISRRDNAWHVVATNHR